MLIEAPITVRHLRSYVRFLLWLVHVYPWSLSRNYAKMGRFDVKTTLFLRHLYMGKFLNIYLHESQ